MRAVFVGLFILLGIGAFAQRICSTVEYSRRLPVSIVTKHSTASKDPTRDTVPGEIITVPVVIHILYNTAEQNITNEQVYSQLKVLNDDYRRLNADASNTPLVFRSAAADTKIMFCIAQVDPNGRSTKGIIHKQTIKPYFQDETMKYSAAGGDDAWDSHRYLNIWVCNMFGRSLGFATPPGSPADRDGVVINWDVFGTVGAVRSPFNKGRTATHEVGHWLGLKHLWGDDVCGSDDIDDTPSQRSYNFNCPNFPHASTCSPNSYGDMFMNYMDFTDDGCMNMFTNGQTKKMRSLFAINNLRNSFLNSFACDSSLATGAPLPDTILLPPPGPSLMVYPNPVSDFLKVMPLNGYQLNGCKYVLLTIQGSVLQKQVFNSEQGTLNMTGLPAGVYVLQIIKDGGRSVFKVIKK